MCHAIKPNRSSAWIAVVHHCNRDRRSRCGAASGRVEYVRPAPYTNFNYNPGRGSTFQNANRRAFPDPNPTHLTA